VSVGISAPSWRQERDARWNMAEPHRSSSIAVPTSYGVGGIPLTMREMSQEKMIVFKL
jgi:hypothetical protein